MLCDVRRRFASVPFEGQGHDPNVLAKHGIRLTAEWAAGGVLYRNAYSCGRQIR
jgi:hypothetical protein